MHFYEQLPEGYREVYSIDAGNKKAGILLNLVGLLLTVAVGVPLFFLKSRDWSIELRDGSFLIADLVFLVAVIAYLVLHELTHGLFYKIFTHKKLTFGIKLTCAFCGVPDVYMKKVPMIVTAMAPCVIFSIVFLVAIALLPANIYGLFAIILFAVHFGGCVGDLYVSILMAFRYPKDVLINDTGAKQTFYVK